MSHKLILFIASYIFVAVIIFNFFSAYFLYGERTLSKSKGKKKEISDKLKCKMVELRYRNRLANEYYWHSISRFAWTNVSFVVASLGALYLGGIWGIVAGVLLLIIYIFFLKFVHKRYKVFPIIAKKKLEEFEKPIEDAIKKAAEFPGDTIREYMVGDEMMAEDVNKIIIIKQPKEVTKFDFPPFVLAKDRTVIKTRKLEYIVFTNEYVCAFTSATKFDLLKPDRKPQKDGCEEKTKGLLGGSTQEHYYSNIEFGKFDGDTFKIWYKDGREFELITVADKKAPELKKRKGQILGALKQKLRITERQVLRKVDEYTKLEQYKQLKEEVKQQEKKEESSEN